MAEITPSQVKALRDKTGAGMMDCKKALTENGGEIEAAVDWLRKKGLAAAAKRAGRAASQGLVSLAVAGPRGVVVEVNSETDFVARNETFKAFVKAVTQLALEKGGDVESLKKSAFPGGSRTVEAELTELIAKIGENMSFRRAAVLEVKKGAIGAYTHSALTAGMGKIGVLVALESDGDVQKLEALGKQIAMHVAAANPVSVSRDDVDPTLISREKAIFADQARASGKPEAIIEKMVEGRMRKFYEESCLLEQVYVIDPETTVRKVVEAAAKDVGAPIVVKGFVRLALGDGVEAAGEE